MSYREFEGAIRTVMGYYMGLRRNQKGMEIALEKLNFIAPYADRIKAQDITNSSGRTRACSSTRRAS